MRRTAAHLRHLCNRRPDLDRLAAFGATGAPNAEIDNVAVATPVGLDPVKPVKPAGMLED